MSICRCSGHRGPGLFYDLHLCICVDTSVLYCGHTVANGCCSVYMSAGLQTGWVTMGSLQSAILGFGIFQVLRKYGWVSGFSIAENVIVQTCAVASATMPLAAGFVGVIPAKISLQAQRACTCIGRTWRSATSGGQITVIRHDAVATMGGRVWSWTCAGPPGDQARAQRHQSVGAHPQRR